MGQNPYNDNVTAKAKLNDTNVGNPSIFLELLDIGGGVALVI